MRITFVNSICAKHDAISNSIRDQIAALRGAGLDEIRLFSFRCDHGDLPAVTVRGPAEVALDPWFQTSDLVVFHFGIYYSLFDLLPVVPRRARSLVVFHNVTPKEFVGAGDRPLIDRSFVQMSNIAWADHVLCVSETNLQVLRDAGIDTSATVLPLAVHTARRPPPDKPSFADGTLRIAFVGRFVRSKGPHELLAAVDDLARARPDASVRVDLIGNQAFSDPCVLRQVEEWIGSLADRHGARIEARLSLGASDAFKRQVLQAADLFVLPTYHEGFCVPIVEAMGAGCVVVAYDNSNVPAICGGQGVLVSTGDLAMLGATLIRMSERIGSVDWRGAGPGSYDDYVRRCEPHLMSFDPQRVDRRFVELARRLASAPAASHRA